MLKHRLKLAWILCLNGVIDLAGIEHGALALELVAILMHRTYVSPGLNLSDRLYYSIFAKDTVIILAPGVNTGNVLALMLCRIIARMICVLDALGELYLASLISPSPTMQRLYVLLFSSAYFSPAR